MKKQITNQQAISFLNQLIDKVDAHFADIIDNPKTRESALNRIESHGLQIISDINKVIRHISLYN